MSHLRSTYYIKTHFSNINTIAKTQSSLPARPRRDTVRPRRAVTLSRLLQIPRSRALFVYQPPRVAGQPLRNARTADSTLGPSVFAGLSASYSPADLHCAARIFPPAETPGGPRRGSLRAHVARRRLSIERRATGASNLRERRAACTCRRSFRRQVAKIPAAGRRKNAAREAG